MVLKMSGYVKSFDETNCLSFLIKNNELLGKCNKTVIVIVSKWQ